MATNVNVTFKGGLGSVTARLFRNGEQIGIATTDKSANITLPDVQELDAISISGVSPNNGTDVSISAETDPSTPIHFKVGTIVKSLDVLKTNKNNLA